MVADLFAGTDTCENVDLAAMLVPTYRAIDRLLAEKPVSISWSGGKDSSVVVHIVLDVARRRVQRGLKVHPIAVLSADTLVEQPEITRYARVEMQGMLRFAQQHRLDVRVICTKPRLTESWALSVISGRSLPSYYGGNSDCTVNLKSNPLRRAQKKLDGEFPGLVAVLGTRFDESTRRAANMRKRSETAECVWTGVDDRPYLSPLAYWTDDHVWEFVGLVMADETKQTYSNWAELFRIYKDAGGGACVVLEAMSGMVKHSPCGARTGCWACVQSERDRSLETMLETDPRYEYMRGLNQLRNWLLAIRFDWSLRTWMPWAPNPDGTLEIKPHRFRPRVLAELLRMCLSLDVREQEAARGLGIDPRFQIIDVRSLVAIDAYWGLHGMHRPFEALRIYREVCEQRLLMDVPVIPPAPHRPMPTAGVFQIEPWLDRHPLGGMFNPVVAMHEDGPMSGTFDSVLAISERGGCIGHRQLADGRLVQTMNEGDFFDVDLEGAEDLLQFELDYLLQKRDEQPVTTYLTYAQYGVISAAPKYAAEIDSMVRRAQWKHRVGLDLDKDPEALLARVRELAERYQAQLGLERQAAMPRRVQMDLFGA